MQIQRYSPIFFNRVVWIAGIILFITGCETVDNSSRTGTGPFIPLSSMETGADQGLDMEKQAIAQVERVKKKVSQTGDKESYISAGPVIKIEGEDHQEINFFDRYEQLLKELIEKKDKIKSLEDRVSNDEQVIKDLENKLKEKEENIKKDSGTIEELRTDNDNLKEYIEKMKEEMEPYRKEVKELKLNLLKAQIAETKAKQELIRLKTQYLIDKKIGDFGPPLDEDEHDEPNDEETGAE